MRHPPILLLPILLALAVTAFVPRASSAQLAVDLDVPVRRPADRPVLSLGDQGGAPYEFYRVLGATRLEGGRLAVLNAGSFEVRIFGPDGSFERALGGEGEGPGEFTRPTRLFRMPGDSLLVWDRGSLRASVLSPDDGFVRSVALQPRPDSPTLEGVSADGRLVVSAVHFSLERTGELTRMPESRFLYSSAGARLDSLGLSPGRAAVINVSPDRVEVLGPIAPVSTTYAVGGESLWIETGERHGVALHRLDSGETRSFVWDGPPLEMTDARIRAITEAALAEVDDPEERRRLRASYEVRPVPERIPATERVLADDRGRGWVERAGEPGVEGPAEWLVLSPEGVVEARIELPRSMTLLGVDGNDVLVVERDLFDLEYVRQYPLVER